ncbi:hypothetical protein [Tomitella gaofuii]|uniref:hypothetical protein n=1 Tax=Tomitella gaofuii TaxID=2760083 RepID=UPI0015FD3937|nr:hypothetical protein [Tomitella gaofuii]
MIGYTTRVQVVRPLEERDRYENVRYNYEAGEVRDVPALVSLQPVGQDSDDENRVMVTGTWVLRTRPGTDIDLVETDRVRSFHGDMKVEGIGRWPHPIRPGGVHHAEVKLQVVTG